MTRKVLSRERLKFFLMGIVVAGGLFCILGASDPNPALNSGRYQVSAWASPFGPEGGGVGAFVVDTVSGETKAVYTRLYGKVPEGRTVKNDLRKPFSAIQ